MNSAEEDFRTSDGEVVRRVDLDRAAGSPSRFVREDPSVAGYEGVELAKAALMGDQAALDEFHELAGLALPGVTEYGEGFAVRLVMREIDEQVEGLEVQGEPACQHDDDGRAVFQATNEGGHNSTCIDVAELVGWIFSPEGRAALARRGVVVPPVVSTTSSAVPTVSPAVRTSSPTSRSIPPYDAVGPTCPLGFPMQQNRHAVPTWSYAMECYPPTRIIEIGSYNGGFTTAIGVHAQQIGARVVSYDVAKAPHARLAALAQFLGIEFRTVDVWTLEKEIGQLIAGPGVTFVLCDGGNKRRELATFAQYLKPGDVIAAHDYVSPGSVWWSWSEIRTEDGAAAVASHDLEPWLQEHFDIAGWLVFRRRGSGKK